MTMILFRAKGWKEEDLAKRIHGIVSGLSTTDCPYKKDNGEWQLDEANNWFLAPRDPEEYTLMYRHWGRLSHGTENDRRHLAFAVVLRELLGVEILWSQEELDAAKRQGQEWAWMLNP